MHGPCFKALQSWEIYTVSGPDLNPAEIFPHCAMGAAAVSDHGGVRDSGES